MVVGAGPVGASLARAVRGMSVALVAHEKRVAHAREGFDARVYALSPGNADFLRGLGTWPAGRATPVHAMRIFGDAGSSIGFDAYDAGVPALAWIVEDAVLQDALWSGLEVEVIAPAHGESLSITGESAGLRLREGGTLEAKLPLREAAWQRGVPVVPERRGARAAAAAGQPCVHGLVAGARTGGSVQGSVSRRGGGARRIRARYTGAQLSLAPVVGP